MDMENTTGFLTSRDNSSEEGNQSFMYPSSPIEPGYILAYNIYLYLMVIFGVLGNVIVLVVFLFTRPSNTTDWFIFAITICDFISSSVNVPVYATFTNGYWRIYGTTLICRLHMFLSQSIVLSSSFLICGLALDRYFKICRHLSSFTPARARNACLLITVLTTILSIPSFVMYENRAGRCVAIVMNTTLFAYFLLVFVIFLLATIVVVFSYCKVTKAVAASESNISKHSECAQTKTADRREFFCCCPPFYYENNKVLPSTSTPYGASSSGLPLTEISNSNTLSIHKDTGSKGHQLSVTRLSTEVVTNSSDLRSSIPNNSIKQRKSAALRTTKISFLVCSVFILSWVPPWLCFILASVPGMKTNPNVVTFMLFGRMTYLINGFTNPIIYTLLNKKFRNRILYILCQRTCFASIQNRL